MSIQWETHKPGRVIRHNVDVLAIIFWIAAAYGAATQNVWLIALAALYLLDPHRSA